MLFRFYATGFDVVNHLPRYVHHVVIGALASPRSSTCRFTCFDMPEMIGMVYGWAVGMGDVPEALGAQRRVLEFCYFATGNALAQSFVHLGRVWLMSKAFW